MFARGKRYVVSKVGDGDQKEQASSNEIPQSRAVAAAQRLLSAVPCCLFGSCHESKL